jgi:ribosomal protein S18 acetylase RimI-like enzyme
MRVTMADIEYIETDENGLDLVAPLWRKLVEHHKIRSEHFKGHFDRMTWEKRKKGLLDKSRNGAVLVNIARDGNSPIGYCVSTVSGDKAGEIESIFIEERYRRCGIGDHFMKEALSWMQDHAVTRKSIAVAAGNEEAFGFYSRYGFYPVVSVLEQVRLE